jgi:hypothetical protein
MVAAITSFYASFGYLGLDQPAYSPYFLGVFFPNRNNIFLSRKISQAEQCFFFSAEALFILIGRFNTSFLSPIRDLYP